MHQINQDDVDSPYQISVNAISEERDFWEFVDRNRGEITELKFKYIAPNILGGGDSARNYLKKLRDEVNMQELDVSVINRDGKINPESEQVRESVDYLTKGGGSIEAKKGRKIIYSSEKNVQTKK